MWRNTSESVSCRHSWTLRCEVEPETKVLFTSRINNSSTNRVVYCLTSEPENFFASVERDERMPTSGHLPYFF